MPTHGGCPPLPAHWAGYPLGGGRGRGHLSRAVDSCQRESVSDRQHPDEVKSGAMKLYLAGPMFTAAEEAHNLRLAAKLRDHGFAVFCPNESEPSSDKTRTDITPRLIYDVDIEAVESCNVLICQVSEDSGTNWEAGYMNCLSRRVDPERYYGVIGLATDIRLRTPPHPERHGVETQTPHINALAIGRLQGSLGVYLDEDSMIERLQEIRREREGGR